MKRTDLWNDLRLGFFGATLVLGFIFGAVFEARWPFWAAYIGWIGLTFILSPDPRSEKWIGPKKEPERKFQHFELKKDEEDAA